MKNNVLKLVGDKSKKYIHSLFFKKVVVSVDDKGVPTKTIEKKRSKFYLFCFYFLVLFILSKCQLE